MAITGLLVNDDCIFSPDYIGLWETRLVHALSTVNCQRSAVNFPPEWRRCLRTRFCNGDRCSFTGKTYRIKHGFVF